MNSVLTITEINKYIKDIVAKDPKLAGIWARGEISNCKYHSSGHIYMTLKDEYSVLRCVMFRSSAAGLKFRLKDGMKVLVRGYVSVFERDGQYQLYAEMMQPDGIGSLHVAFEQLKRKLYEEGLFMPEKKKLLPFLPDAIGVVTSSTGAVIRDILNVLNRRYPNFNLKLYPVHVQGEQAPQEIAHAIDRLNELDCVDVIIIARGGGSLEELWAFNEEIVARSIYRSHIPVISAVGHETDFTIADFVADVRAPTPSAAAELVIPEKNAVRNTVLSLDARLKHALLKNLDIYHMKYEKLRSSIAFRQPYTNVYQQRMRLDVLNRRIEKASEAGMVKVKSTLSMLVGKLDALSPLSVLARGYSIAVLKSSGRVVKSVAGVSEGDLLELSVSDGTINCIVESRAKGD